MHQNRFTTLLASANILPLAPKSLTRILRVKAAHIFHFTVEIEIESRHKNVLFFIERGTSKIEREMHLDGEK